MYLESKKPSNQLSSFLYHTLLSSEKESPFPKDSPLSSLSFEPQVVDRLGLFIPSGWDTLGKIIYLTFTGKIKVLNSSFDPASFGLDKEEWIEPANLAYHTLVREPQLKKVDYFIIHN